ncbi:hypothetical protein [Flaviaesturariibacter terrae]
MRRLLALCCLLLLLLTMGGRSLFFELRMAELRSEMRRALAKGVRPERVETLNVAETGTPGFHWLDEGSEFEWQGRRYDVLALQRSGPQIVIQALSDQQETALVAAFRHTAKNDDGHVASLLLLKLAVLTYIAPAACPVPGTVGHPASCRHEKHQDLHPLPWRNTLLEPPLGTASLT